MYLIQVLLTPLKFQRLFTLTSRCCGCFNSEEVMVTSGLPLVCALEGVDFVVIANELA